MLPLQPTVSVQLDDLIPLRNGPNSIGPNVGWRALPVPCLHGNLPGLTIVGLNVLDGFTGHMNLHVYKLSPAQCKFGKQIFKLFSCFGLSASIPHMVSLFIEEKNVKFYIIFSLER